MKILWTTNIPSPYRVNFFNELGKLCELTVLFEKSSASDRDCSWSDFTSENFEGIALRGLSYSADSAASFGALAHLTRRTYDAVVVTNFSSPTGALAVAYLRTTGRLYYLESDGGFPGSGKVMSWIKRRVISGASGYLSTSEENDRYFLTYGATHEGLLRYPFTSVRETEVLSEPPAAMERLAAKRSLGIAQAKLVLAVGQFIRRKGFDVLLESFAALPCDVALYIVGGEPTAEYLAIVARLGLANVHFAPFVPPVHLKVYFAAADLFVLPTREDIWGLVVNEALANALPVITTDRCIAGLELVAPNACGTIVPVGDVERLSEAMTLLLEDEGLRTEMQDRALRVGRQYTIEEMARRHEQVLREGVRSRVSSTASASRCGTQ